MGLAGIEPLKSVQGPPNQHRPRCLLYIQAMFPGRAHCCVTAQPQKKKGPSSMWVIRTGATCVFQHCRVEVPGEELEGGRGLSSMLHVHRL